MLTIDGLVAAPDIELAVATAGFYGINDARANAIVDNTRAIVSTWKARARKMRIAAGDIELTGSAFSALDEGAGGADKHALHRRGHGYPRRPGIRPRPVARHAEVSGFTLAPVHDANRKVSFVLSGVIKPAEGPPAG